MAEKSIDMKKIKELQEQDKRNQEQLKSGATLSSQSTGTNIRSELNSGATGTALKSGATGTSEWAKVTLPKSVLDKIDELDKKGLIPEGKDRLTNVMQHAYEEYTDELKGKAKAEEAMLKDIVNEQARREAELAAKAQKKPSGKAKLGAVMAKVDWAKLTKDERQEILEKEAARSAASISKGKDIMFGGKNGAKYSLHDTLDENIGEGTAAWLTEKKNREAAAKELTKIIKRYGSGETGFGEFQDWIEKQVAAKKPEPVKEKPPEIQKPKEIPAAAPERKEKNEEEPKETAAPASKPINELIEVSGLAASSNAYEQVGSLMQALQNSGTTAGVNAGKIEELRKLQATDGWFGILGRNQEKTLANVKDAKTEFIWKGKQYHLDVDADNQIVAVEGLKSGKEAPEAAAVKEGAMKTHTEAIAAYNAFVTNEENKRNIDMSKVPPEGKERRAFIGDLIGKTPEEADQILRARLLKEAAETTVAPEAVQAKKPAAKDAVLEQYAEKMRAGKEATLTPAESALLEGELDAFFKGNRKALGDLGWDKDAVRAELQVEAVARKLKTPAEMDKTGESPFIITVNGASEVNEGEIQSWLGENILTRKPTPAAEGEVKSGLTPTVAAKAEKGPIQAPEEGTKEKLGEGSVIQLSQAEFDKILNCKENAEVRDGIKDAIAEANKEANVPTTTGVIFTSAKTKEQLTTDRAEYANKLLEVVSPVQFKRDGVEWDGNVTIDKATGKPIVTIVGEHEKQ